MILPIVAYGDPMLKKAAEITPEDYPDLKQLVADMFETMQFAKGVGLAAPQIGKSIRMFLVDASPFAEDDKEGKHQHLRDFKKVFINPEIQEEWGDEWNFEEGCLSIPGIREDVWRNEKIRIKYLDENFNLHEDQFDDISARIIQHEYDHIEGVLFTDHLNPLKRRLLKKRLLDISRGIVDVKYKMRFPLKR
ncbi:MAG: peptide deformylase [Flavobacteriales bacterium]|nr:MAG: peptide deformylase [Flavobacteriales bacterium]